MWDRRYNNGKYNADELFYDDTHVPSEELFWKTKKYAWQQEVRVIIANINFKSLFGVGKHDYRKCYLEVELPHFQEYAEIYSAIDVEQMASVLSGNLYAADAEAVDLPEL